MARLFCGIGTLTLSASALLAMLGSRPASAEFLTPEVFASIDDENFDGIGDVFSTLPGLLRHTAQAETRTITEFHLGGMRVEELDQAKLYLELTVNNSGGIQTRSYDVHLYPGNGEANLFDYFLAGPVVDRITFDVPQEPNTFLPISFELDIRDAARTLLGGQADVIGIRLNPIGGQSHFPTILTSIRLSVVPEPSGAVLLGLGLGLLWVGRQRCRSRSYS